MEPVLSVSSFSNNLLHSHDRIIQQFIIHLIKLAVINKYIEQNTRRSYGIYDFVNYQGFSSYCGNRGTFT